MYIQGAKKEGEQMTNPMKVKDDLKIQETMPHSWAQPQRNRKQYSIDKGNICVCIMNNTCKITIHVQLYKKGIARKFWLFKLCLCISMHVLTIGQSWLYAYLLWFYPQLPIRCQGKTTTPNYTHIHTHTKVGPGMVWHRHFTRSGCKVFLLFLLLCGS